MASSIMQSTDACLTSSIPSNLALCNANHMCPHCSLWVLTVFFSGILVAELKLNHAKMPFSISPLPPTESLATINIYTHIQRFASDRAMFGRQIYPNI